MTFAGWLTGRLYATCAHILHLIALSTLVIYTLIWLCIWSTLYMCHMIFIIIN